MAAKVRAAPWVAGFGERVTLPGTTTGPWASPPGRVMQKSPLEASVPFREGIPLSWATTLTW